MQICHTIDEIKAVVREAQTQGKKVGLVPTMGYFHAGHISLMQTAKKQCDLVVVSIYVNPMQFGPREDFAQYPRDLQRDSDLARQAGVDLVFAPADDQMYPAGFCTHVDLAGITEGLCGQARPGHFRGVATVVTKLFNIVTPDVAYFGQKDAQQALVIQQMVQDLNMNLKVEVCPTVRESDGLAMSSRNTYLHPSQRQAAVVLYQSLLAFQRAVEQGEKDVGALRRLIVEKIEGAPGAQIDYVQILTMPPLQPVEQLQGRCLAAVAVRFGATRLIDNMVVEV